MASPVAPGLPEAVLARFPDPVGWQGVVSEAVARRAEGFDP